MEISFGIDFGTTNSACTGIIKPGTILNFGEELDGRPFPSIVIIDPKNGQIWTGRDAWEQRNQLKRDCIVIPSIKSHMGSKKTWDIAGQTWTPAMVAAEVLMGLQRKVETRGGDMELKEAVVAVPVRFSQAQRADLRLATRLAGIRIKSIVNEPTAAFFQHYAEVKGFSRIGVIDWGGGTLDIAVLENRDGNVSEIAVDGHQLGGDDIDLKIAHYVHDQVMQKKGGNIKFEDMHPSDQDSLLIKCESAKIDLGSRDRVNILLTSYGNFGSVNERIESELFARLIEREVTTAIAKFENLLNEYSISMHELGAILMVGGSVNLAPFRDMIEERWPDANIIPPVDSNWSVAKGAALLSSVEGEYILADDIGVILADDKFYRILKKNTPIAQARSEISFALVEESPTAHFIFAYPGNDTNQAGDILGYMNVPTMGFLKEKIDLVSQIGEDMVLEIAARSQNRSDRYIETWNYPAPRIQYQLPLVWEDDLNG